MLNLTPQTTSNASVKKSYHKIARVIHPDKCKHPDASAAMSVVTAANSTLTTPKLKQSYDLYYNTQDVSENAKSGSNFDEALEIWSGSRRVTSVVSQSVIDASFRRVRDASHDLIWLDLWRRC